MQNLTRELGREELVDESVVLILRSEPEGSKSKHRQRKGKKAEGKDEEGWSGKGEHVNSQEICVQSTLFFHFNPSRHADRLRHKL